MLLICGRMRHVQVSQICCDILSSPFLSPKKNVIIGCFSDKCDPNSFPEKGNVTELCTPSQHVIDTNSTINELQKCINESENFCTDCQHQFSTMDNLQLFKDGHKFCFEMVFKVRINCNFYLHFCKISGGCQE